MTSALLLARGQRLAADVDAALCGYADAEALLDALIARCDALPARVAPTPLTQRERSMAWLQGGIPGVGGGMAGMRGMNMLEAHAVAQRQAHVAYGQRIMSQAQMERGLMVGLTHDSNGEPWK